MDYSTADATRAFFKFHADQGYNESQVNQPASDGYDDDDGYTFINRNADGTIYFKVEFHDDDGNATVTVPGDSESPGEVNIREDDEDEDDEDEDA